MAVRRNRDGQQLSLFADVLKEARHNAGLSSDELGAKIGYSGALIRSVESGHRLPKAAFAKALDVFFGYPKVFELMEERLRDLPFPASYRPFVPYERSARVLRIFEPALVTGLLQTEGYARAVLAKRPHATADEVEDALAARLARQEILTRDVPPLVYCLLDESVLHRPVATPDVMHDQLEHLVHVSNGPNVSVQIVPYAAGGHVGLLGALTIAEAADMTATAFTEDVAGGQTLEDPERVALVVAHYDALRGEALPVGASREIIERAQEKWTTA